MKLTKFLNCLLCVVLFNFCSTTKKNENTTKALVIDAKEFKTKIEASNNIQIIDVRTSEEFAEGKIASAENINVYDEDFEKQIQKLNKEIPVYLYCKAGVRSANAAKVFEKNGFKSIYNLDGGMDSWLENKFKVVKEITKREDLTVEEFEQLVKTNDVVIVDFNAVWCGPCKRLSPILDQLQKDYGKKIKVIKIDTDKNKILSDHFVIMSIPFLQFYKNGKVQEQIEGLPSKANLVYQIEKLLK